MNTQAHDTRAPTTNHQMKLSLFLATVLTLALSAPGFAQALDEAKLDAFLDRLSQKNQAMGSLALTKGGEAVYRRAFGYSLIDGAERTPATVSTRYRMASITKMFTAVMVFQLIEEGKLELSDTLDNYYPQIRNAERISIAQLLGHRSGVHDFTKGRVDPEWRTRAKTKEQMIAVIAGGKPEFEPGALTDYSNSGFLLLGYIVEEVGAAPYPQALRERISSKLELKATTCGIEDTGEGEHESASYRWVSDWERQVETHLSIAGGAGALISTPTDLAAFIRGLFDLELVSQDSLDQMVQHSFGMETFTYNGATCYGHTGGIDNFGSWLAYDPREKLAVAYLSNAKVYPVADIVQGVFDIYWGDPFEIPSFESLAVSPEVLESYVGVYSNPEAPVQFVVTREDATLFLQMSGQSAVPLEATAMNRFEMANMGMALEFDATTGQMTLLRGGRGKVFTKGD